MTRINLDPILDPPPPFAPPTDLNSMIGKAIAGYQLWFGTSGGWSHWWSSNNSGTPGPGNIKVELWPAGWEDYAANGAAFRDTDFIMSDKTAGRLFDSKDEAIIRTHHQWMRDAGIDGSAVQRFFENTSPVDTGSASNHLITVRDAAQDTGRIFYVMYDMSAAGRPDYFKTVVNRIQLDWIYNVERKCIVSSPNYAQAENKPVVCIWGIHAIESTDNYRYPTVVDTIELIKWFRSRGYYVIGGIPDDFFWKEDSSRHPLGREMYACVDMISPWYVGRDVTGQVLDGSRLLSKGMDFCRENPRSWADNRPIAFMPTIWPGFAWTNMGAHGGPNRVPRNAGQWIWTQFQGYGNSDSNNEIKSLYLAMFDEYDEATAWMKAAADYFDIPLDQYFLTHAADGTWLSSDYYLRLSKELIRAFKESKGSIPPLNDYNNPQSVIVEHSLGPVFWRNSFERRQGRIVLSSRPNFAATPVYHLQIDVGVPNGSVMGIPLNVTISGAFTVNRPPVERSAVSDNYHPPSATLGMVYTSDDSSYSARSGESAFRLAGQRTAGTGALYRYKIADTRMRVMPGMRLHYWVHTSGLGTNVMVDLLLDNGDYVSDVTGKAPENDGSPQNGWQQKNVTLPASLNGSYITAVIIAYRDSGSETGDFAALIDDIIIDKTGVIK